MENRYTDLKEELRHLFNELRESELNLNLKVKKALSMITEGMKGRPYKKGADLWNL